ncbi:MAG: glutamine--fructose-6-phosphate transaminase (isomerizing) [Bacilli bacterium]|nr:glutamine--fructose-6-phosphate transaminase (isomerizing) [Bacilli bacterium]
MCGIIGYIGSRKTTEVLLKGLYALEYRGYDSAGVAITDNKDLEIIRSVGRVSKLEEKIEKEKKVNSTFGIAHTRWATNGEANEKNAHPHKIGKVTLVHNGIIENADLIKEKLINEGYKFNSDTDSEVAAALLDKYLKENDTLEAIDKMTKDLTGSFAFGIIIDGENRLYALRKDSPLLIGVGEKENFLASDITAIISYTPKYVLLDVGEVAVLEDSSLKFYKEGKEIEKEILVSDSKGVDHSKNGYDHYMLKEIMEEPVVIKRLIERYNEEENRKELDLSEYKEIDIVACGSAMYAGLVGQNLLEEFAEIKVNVYPASEYRYKKKIYNTKTLVILVSQSGETADTIAAMREAQKLGIDTLGIVNNPDSTIARETSRKILTNAGVEIAVATTKAYILQVCVLAMMAFVSGEKKGLVKEDFSIFSELPKLIKEVQDRVEEYKKIAKDIYKKESCFFIGRGLDYALCMEGSLKLKEVSYLHSEAYQAGELKHGTISLVEEGMPVLCIITNKELKDKSISNLKETEARGAKGIVITTKDLDDFDEYEKIVVPESSQYIVSMLIVPALQLLSYYVALNRGCDIDKPRNLAKSVTVE